MRIRQYRRAGTVLAGVGMALLCLCGCVNCGTFGDSDYASPDDLPCLEALVFASEGSAIYGQVLVPSSQFTGARPCAIFCHGFAGFTRWDDVAHDLCRAGLTIAAHGAARASTPSRAAYATRRIWHAGRGARILPRSTARTPMPSILSDTPWVGTALSMRRRGRAASKELPSSRHATSGSCPSSWSGMNWRNSSSAKGCMFCTGHPTRRLCPTSKGMRRRCVSCVPLNRLRGLGCFLRQVSTIRSCRRSR